VKLAIDIRKTSVSAYTRHVLRGLAMALFAVAISSAGQVSQQPSNAASADSFDVPIRILAIDLGRSPYTPDDNIRNTLSCFYFPGLLIKQYDQGQVGSEWLAIHRFRGKPPECSMSHEPGEHLIQQSAWGGYFRGKKNNLLVFDGGECQQGSCLFSVYDSISRKRIFEDEEVYRPAKEPPWDRMRVFSTKAGTAIRYLRVAEAGCDLHKEGEVCWKRVHAKLHLKWDTIPDCEGYEPEALAHYVLDLNEPVESMISYPVEVTLSDPPVVTNLAGPVRCWATH
jgi:hypothetical protein